MVPKLAKAVGAAGLVGETKAKANASGRPGPRAITGRLRGSINSQLVVSNPLTPKAVVGSNVEYARRIEKGFVGQDSKGRVYDQPAYPYLLPALEDAENGLVEALNSLFD